MRRVCNEALLGFHRLPDAGEQSVDCGDERLHLDWNVPLAERVQILLFPRFDTNGQ